MTQAKYIETFAGYDYFRDERGNIHDNPELLEKE